MEWDLKMPSWDFADMEQNAEQGMVPVVAGPSSWPSNQDCSVDLKLGGLGDFGQADRWKVQPRVPAAPSVAAASSSKRCRTLNNAGQIACCLVDGCKSDLSKCRDYHRRHKVCEVHSKTQIVMVGGQEQRFCQQCSRFHLLVEFDEVKRSCRKRLDGHNRRRRKPQPDPLNTANLFTNHQGIRFTSYPPLFPSNTPGGSAWPGIMKTEQDTMFTNQQSSSFISSRQQNLPSSFYINFKEGKKFPFLQDSETALGHRISLEASEKTIPSSQCSSMKMLPDGINHILDSEGALSLLSSPIQTAAINLSHMVHSDRIPVGQPLVSSLTYSGLGHYSGSQASSSVSPTGFSCSGMDDDHEGNILVSDASDADLPCHGIFPVGGEGSSDGASQALPFWL